MIHKSRDPTNNMSKSKINPASCIIDLFCKVQKTHRSVSLHNCNLARFAVYCCTYVLIISLWQAPTLAFGNSWIEEDCRRKAAEYDAFLSYKKIVTPEHAAKVYSSRFSTKGASREAQAVWRLMSKDNISVEQAINTHFERYHSKRSTDEKEILRKEISQQIHDITIIHDLVLTFEKATLTSEFVMDVMNESWRKRDNWSAPKPIEYYLDMIKSKYDDYVRSGINKERAAIQAAVDARNAVERDRGVSSGSIYDNNHICYKDELNRFELWLRKAALDPLTEEEAKDVMENAKLSQSLSRLTYYTHTKFGPRDYSLDRFNTWQIAADEISDNR